jgi:hypothetical protein
MNRFHCCASCIHFRVTKQEDGVKYFCSRLGYETKPHYQFHCWNPKNEVQKLMKKERES